jgi:hypothetical protein
MKAVPNYLSTNMHYERPTLSDRIRGGGQTEDCSVKSNAKPYPEQL